MKTNTKILLLMGLTSLVFACGDSKESNLPAIPQHDLSPYDFGENDMGRNIDKRPFLNTLDKVEDYEAMADENVIKYLINIPGKKREEPLTEDCYFQNMKTTPWHYQFLKSFKEYSTLDVETYTRWILYKSQRRFYGGAFRYWEKATYPGTQNKGVYSFSVYGNRGQLEVKDVENAYLTIKKCTPLSEGKLVYISDSTAQKEWLGAKAKELDEKGIPYLFPNQLIGNEHIVYNAGEAYGTLHVIDEGKALDDDYGPLDIVVSESAPNDISVVQALITKDPQNALSHTNLRLREKKAPNVALKTIYTNAKLIEFKDKLIHLVVSKDQFLIEAATLSDAQAFWDAKKPQVPDVKSDLSVTDIAGFDSIKNSEAISYGAKAANLGELYAILPEANRNPGFAIPFSAYVNHIEAAEIHTLIDSLLADERMKTDADFKRKELKKLRKKIKKATVSSDLITSIRQNIVDTFGADFTTKRIRFRSSTNVEDLDAITGAGLYDSKSGCIADDEANNKDGPSLCLSMEEKASKEAQLIERKAEFKAHPERLYLEDIIDDIEGDLSKSKPVAKALGKVWASLWNLRAYDEREYYGIDHKKAFMAISVNPAFVLEKASAVALTELKVDAGLPLYRLNSQIGEESVVRPDDPTAIAEVLNFRRDSKAPFVVDVKILVPSTLLNAEEHVWTDSQLAELGSLLFLAHDHFKTNVYSHLANFSLDVEIKLTSDGRIVLKQARPFIVSP